MATERQIKKVSEVLAVVNVLAEAMRPQQMSALRKQLAGIGASETEIDRALKDPETLLKIEAEVGNRSMQIAQIVVLADALESIADTIACAHQIERP